MRAHRFCHAQTPPHTARPRSAPARTAATWQAHSHARCSVAICGAGVIGAAAAYYLARRGVRCTVIDRGGAAAAASGRAGGFLAKDWCDGSPVGRLARKSFELHAGLQDELGEDIDYRRAFPQSLRALRDVNRAEA